MSAEHFKRLERMYLSANINREIFNTTTIKIQSKQAEISLKVSDNLFHALGAMHGAVYFKLLDDAAYFAANSVETSVFLLTSSFNINFLRPVKTGNLRAFGKLKYAGKELFVAEAALYDANGKEVAFGTGNFAKSKISLTEQIGYQWI